jgi:hypothetical protein
VNVNKTSHFLKKSKKKGDRLFFEGEEKGDRLLYFSPFHP